MRGFCSKLTSARLQQLLPRQVLRLPEFLACQETKHEQSVVGLSAFSDMVVGAVTAACHAALEHLETQLAQACSRTQGCAPFAVQEQNWFPDIYSLSCCPVAVAKTCP